MAYTQERRDRIVSSPKKTFSRVFNVFCVFLIGYLTANFFNFTQLTDWVHRVTKASSHSRSNANIGVKPTSLPKPKFEFYTLLEKNEDERLAPNKAHARTVATANNTKLLLSAAMNNKNAAAPQKNLVNNTPSTPVSKNALPAPGTTAKANVMPPSPVNVPNGPTLQGQEKNSYWIQIASFKGKPEAERLKASLTLKGFDVQIKTAAANQGSWFRVLLGPYSTKNAAEKMQLAIAQNERIHGMVYRS